MELCVGRLHRSTTHCVRRVERGSEQRGMQRQEFSVFGRLLFGSFLQQNIRRPKINIAAFACLSSAARYHFLQVTRYGCRPHILVSPGLSLTGNRIHRPFAFFGGGAKSNLELFPLDPSHSQPGCGLGAEALTFRGQR